jgi:hypothetical protein
MAGAETFEEWDTRSFLKNYGRGSVRVGRVEFILLSGDSLQLEGLYMTSTFEVRNSVHTFLGLHYFSEVIFSTAAGDLLSDENDVVEEIIHVAIH